MTKAEALYFINTLGSKHVTAQPILRKLVRGEQVSETELGQLENNDSRLTAVVPIIRELSVGQAGENTAAAISALDSHGAPLQPVLLALLAGLN
jgi:hypothetical protein